MKSNSVRRRVMFGAFALSFCATVYCAGEPASETTSDKKGAAYPKGHYAALDKLPDWGGIWTITFGGPGRTRRAEEVGAE